jgi:hypothetical protein
MQLVTSGTHPDRLESPKMDDDTWNLLQRCWEMDPSKRPTMEELRTTLKGAEAFTLLQSLLATLKKVYNPGTLCAATNCCWPAQLKGTMANKNMPRRICEVFDLDEIDISGLTMVQDDAVFYMSKLLNLHDTHTIASELGNNSDIELILDFVLDVCIVLLSRFIRIQCFMSFSYSAMAV